MTAMTLRPTGDMLYAACQSGYQSVPGSSHCFLKVETSTGNQLGRLVCSIDKDREYYIFTSNSLYWDPYDRLFAMLDVDSSTGDTVDGTIYAGYATVLSLDVSVAGEEKLEHHVELNNWFSAGSAIAYLDNGIDG